MSLLRGRRSPNLWAIQRAIARREAEAALTHAQLIRSPGPLRAPGSLSPADAVREYMARRELCRALGRQSLPW